jgi:hypothetical protein
MVTILPSTTTIKKNIPNTHNPNHRCIAFITPPPLR